MVPMLLLFFYTLFLLEQKYRGGKMENYVEQCAFFCICVIHLLCEVKSAGFSWSCDLPMYKKTKKHKNQIEINELICMQTIDLCAAVQTCTCMCTCILKMLITTKSVKAHSPARLIKQHHLIYIRN